MVRMWGLVGMLVLVLGVWADEHAFVIPLTYEASSQLMTATLAIGQPLTSYHLVVDTGSPFVVLQEFAFRRTSTTYEGGQQPDMGDAQGFITTSPTPDGDGHQAPVKPQMHFVSDTAFLVGAGGRARGGATAANLTLALTSLPDLQHAQGILGLSPPFSKVVGKPPTPGGAGGGGGTKLPSLDVSFLHSFLSDENRKRLGISGASHFYTTFTPPTDTTAAMGQLVFPLTGTTVPNVEGFAMGSAISIDPSSGSTYPAHPFWGIAHRQDLGFYMDDKVIDDIRIDALLIDSGTAGVVGPPSEVAKIIAASQGRLQRTSPMGHKEVLADARCSEGIRMGFEIGAGKRAGFTAVRPSGAGAQKTPAQRWEAGRRGGGGLLKSYIDAGARLWTNAVSTLLGHGRIYKRNDKQRLDKRTPEPLLIKIGQDRPKPAPQAEGEQRCGVGVMGNPQVDQMFPSNGPDFKVWILGTDFFQQNLVYHNLDSATTTIIPRSA